jgi:hypothetical protein
MEKVMLIIGVAICVGLLALAYIYLKEAKQRQLASAADNVRWREERKQAGFWNGVERRAPVREFALTSDEKAAAALRIPVAADSVKEQRAEMLEHLEAIADVLQPESEAAPIPKYDYPNFDGFPFNGTAYHQFKDEMLKHGFIMRFVMATKEIQVIYENPNDLRAEVMRKLYTAPTAIYPANLLHDQGCIMTALWAMRKFKSEERLPELDAFIYL